MKHITHSHHFAQDGLSVQLLQTISQLVVMDAYSRLPTSSSYVKPNPTELSRYDDSYLELGFIENSDGRPERMLANEAMMPAKLKGFSAERVSQKTHLVNLATTSEKAQRASYLVPQWIAKSKKPHSVGQELHLPVAVEMCEAVLETETESESF